MPETIRKIVSFVNNEDADDGGWWLPNIQRSFVWKKGQMEKFFDSIMRGYPIGTFLIWKTRESVKMRKFIDNYKDGIRTINYYVPENDRKKSLVLDGQQRLQSLYIALKGKYDDEELYFNVFSGKDEEDGLKYNFKFKKPENAKIEDGWIRVKDIIYDEGHCYKITRDTIKKISESKSLTDDEKELIENNISLLIEKFRDREYLSYQILDSIEHPQIYTLNDIVEIFIRVNSGGTQLSKSDLMFSLLKSEWNEIEEDLEDFLDEINRNGYNFSRDFVLKTSLILIDTGAKYDVAKFKKEENLRKLKDNWEEIKNAIMDVKDFVYGNTFIRHDKALTSYLALIPLIYFRYKYPDKWRDKSKKQLSFWLLRVLLSGSFSGSSDSLLDAIAKNIDDKRDFDIEDINKIIIRKGRNIKVSEETILNSYYGEKKIYLIFSLLYQDTANFSPSYSGNLPSIDHIFPESRLRQMKETNPNTGRKVMIYKKEDRNQIANLMLLSISKNRDEKRDTLPEVWFKDKDKNYLDMHLIPKNSELWKLENFEKFIEERKKLIINKFKNVGLIQE